MTENVIHIVKPRFESDLHRRYLVIDQSVSMHSCLRDRFHWLAFWLSTLQIGISLGLCLLIFADDAFLTSLGLCPEWARVVMGCFAVFALLLSITESRVDWRGISAKHGDAADLLAELKAKYRKAREDKVVDGDAVSTALQAEYVATMARVPAIPENAFPALKARHQFKRVLSMKLSDYPQAPVFVVRCWLRLKGVQEFLRNRGEAPDSD